MEGKVSICENESPISNYTNLFLFLPLLQNYKYLEEKKKEIGYWFEKISIPFASGLELESKQNCICFAFLNRYSPHPHMKCDTILSRKA